MSKARRGPAPLFETSYFLNPKRRQDASLRGRLKRLLSGFPVRVGLWCGFQNIDYAYVHGQKSRIHLGKNCSTMNTLFNVISGDITVGDNTLFGHGCMVLTGIHEFFDGLRGDLHDPPLPETPSRGRDIHIGSGCFIGSGAIILGSVTIGDNVIVAAGAVVSRDIPGNCIAAGVPAKVIRCLSSECFDVPLSRGAFGK